MRDEFTTVEIEEKMVGSASERTFHAHCQVLISLPKENFPTTVLSKKLMEKKNLKNFAITYKVVDPTSLI